eukprot:3439151-Pleurochrysis_carterae.AAC.1
MVAACESGARPSLARVALAVWRVDGLLGFMRGWGASYARAGPTFFIQMPVVEALRTAFGVDNI